MTVLLITTSEVKSRLVMAPEMLGVDAALTSAIEAAQLRVETDLDTQLQAGETTDLFYINPEFFGGVLPPGNLWRLMLTNGLLREDTPVTITVGRTASDVSEVLTPVKLDKAKGLIYLDPHDCDNHYVKVTYGHGFNEGEDLPKWLSEAILGYVPAVLKLGPAVDQSTATAFKDSEDHAGSMLARYLRNIGLTFRPIC